MNPILEQISPETAAAIAAEAQANGVSIDEYLRGLLRVGGSPRNPLPTDLEEFMTAMESLAEQEYRSNTYSRQDIYFDHD
jgi:hypothetical protein